MKYGLGPVTLALAMAALGADKAPPTATEADAVRIYSETCIACHGEGIQGAPRPGVKADWEPRLAYGVEELYYSAMDGVGAQMPPRGMCMQCTDQQLKAVVDYMVKDLE